jgi:hypothetical protein
MFPSTRLPSSTLTAGFHGKGPTCRAVAEHARRINAADLSHPVILAADGSLMDGGHRIKRSA